MRYVTYISLYKRLLNRQCSVSSLLESWISRSTTIFPCCKASTELRCFPKSYTMGNSQTTSKSDKVGFQITHVAPQSPGAQAGLVVDEDFILTMNGLPVPLMDAEKIMNVCKTMINKPVLLAVYSTKTLAMRDVVLIPSENWPGEGILGIKIKLGPYE